MYIIQKYGYTVVKICIYDCFICIMNLDMMFALIIVLSLVFSYRKKLERRKGMIKFVVKLILSYAEFI